MANRRRVNTAILNAIIAAVGAIIVAIIYVFGPHWSQSIFPGTNDTTRQEPPAIDTTRQIPTNPMIDIRGTIRDSHDNPIGGIVARIVRKDLSIVDSSNPTNTTDGSFLFEVDSSTISKNTPLSVLIDDAKYKKVTLSLEVNEKDYGARLKNLGTITLERRTPPDTGDGNQIERFQIQGQVVDAADGKPLSGAKVIVAAHTESDITDSDGNFFIEVLEKRGEKVHVSFIKSGYKIPGKTVSLPQVNWKVSLEHL